jgi:hypothetical protein
MGGLAPGLGSVNGQSWPIVWAHVTVEFLLGRLLERARHCSHAMVRGLDRRVLDGVNVWSLAGFGWESFAWVRYTGFSDGGLPIGSIPGTTHW